MYIIVVTWGLGRGRACGGWIDDDKPQSLLAGAADIISRHSSYPYLVCKVY